MNAVRLRPVLAAALLTLTLGACSSGHTAPAVGSSASAVSGNRITIKDFQFQPGALTVHPGESITVANQDATAHTVTADDKSFDTKTIAPGASATFTAPAKPGTYPYICTIHQYMHGSLTVS
ncbi:metal-binding protein [Streptomyces tateyamensis]|uniref:Metal-binding protein n=1 Tax=Streptomyces tateyamensis TaxID=565073 RepID=A0A2V4MVA2_9ACTN|nr:cupredoxin domain-containing protein [Streptomyces tateyamensis]PYC70172.1 metal-binding protein [Streptomyces tateyamensis]